MGKKREENKLKIVYMLQVYEAEREKEIKRLLS